MWKLIFSSTTNRGTGCNRDPLAGEFAINLLPSECAWFMSEPNRYQWINNRLEEVPTWISEQTEAKLKADQDLVRDAIIGKEEQKNSRKIEHPQIAGAFFKPSPKIDKIIGRSEALANIDPLPTNGGCFDDIDENSVPMTVGQLKKLRNAIIDREEANYLVRKQHIKNMKLAANPLTYDYTTGWN